MNPMNGKRIVRTPHRVSVDDKELYGKSSGCLLPIVILLILATAGSIYVYKNMDRFFPKPVEEEEESAPKPVERQKLKPVETIPVEETQPEEPPPPPPPPKKTVAQMKTEADAAQLALDKEIDAARKASIGKELPAFAGIKFGDILNGTPVATEALEGGKDIAEVGFAYIMNGPQLKSAFRKFGTRPMVKVTPKTHRIFHIEFTQDIVRKPGWRLNEETTNLVAMLSKKFDQKPFALDNAEFPLGRHEFVFPRGETTITIGEYGGVKLKLILEHAGIKASAKAESDEIRQQKTTGTINSKPLVSDRYPNSGMVKLGRARVRNGTPKSFCGVVFGSIPPFGAKMATPTSSSMPKGFFLAYRKSKCEPFANFNHGKAEISSINDAVTAVRLHSNGPTDGLTESEFYKQVREAIERRYKTKPSKTAGSEAMPELTYEVGDLEITLAPDTNGGFSLQAVNTVFKNLW